MSEETRIARIRLPNRGLVLFDGEGFKFAQETDQDKYERVMRYALSSKPKTLIHQPDPLLADASTVAQAVGGVVEFVDPLPPIEPGVIY